MSAKMNKSYYDWGASQPLPAAESLRWQTGVQSQTGFSLDCGFSATALRAAEPNRWAAEHNAPTLIALLDRP